MTKERNWLKHLFDRKDIVSIEYGLCGAFMNARIKTFSGLTFIFKETNEDELYADIHMNFFMDPKHEMAKTGLTHFFEHMMFKRVKIGRKYMSPDEFNKYCADYGIKINARTSDSGIVINFMCNPKALVVNEIEEDEEKSKVYNHMIKDLDRGNLYQDVKVMFDAIFGVAYNHKFTLEDMNSEKDIVKAEIARAYNNDYQKSYRRTMGVLFGPNVYDYFGLVEDIDRITLEDLDNMSNLMIAGSTDPEQVHVLTGNFDLMPEVIDMFINTISKVNSIKLPTLKVEQFNREYGLTLRKIGNPKLKIDGMIARNKKDIIVDLKDSNLVELDFCGEFNADDKRWQNLKYPGQIINMMCILMVYTTNDLSAPITKVFREKLGWTYSVIGSINPTSIDEDKFYLEFNMVLGDHIEPTMETLKFAREELDKIEITKPLINSLLDNRNNDLLKTINKSIWNRTMYPYKPHRPISEMAEEFFFDMKKIPLKDWQYVWDYLMTSMYGFMTVGDKKLTDEEM